MSTDDDQLLTFGHYQFRCSEIRKMTVVKDPLEFIYGLLEDFNLLFVLELKEQIISTKARG